MPDVTSNHVTREDVAALREDLASFSTEIADLEAGRIENAKNIEKLSSAGQRNRMLIHVLVASVIFDICLSVALGIVGVRAFSAANSAKDATSAAAIAHQQAVAQCQAGNEYRVADKKRWQSLLDATPVEQRNTANYKNFQEATNEADQLRDCSKVQ